MKATGKIILALTLVLISFTSNTQEKEKSTSTNRINLAPVKVEYKRLQAPSKKILLRINLK